MEIYRAKFGQTLSALLKERDIKQYQLAEKVGIEPANVSRWVNGVTFPDEPHFKTICRVLGVSPQYFLGESDSPNLLASIIKLAPSLNDDDLREIVSDIQKRLSRSAPKPG